MKWGLKGGISFDADSDPPRYVLWCCDSICHQPDTFIQIGSGHTVYLNSSQISKENYLRLPLVVPGLNLVYHTHNDTGNFQLFCVTYVDTSCLSGNLCLEKGSRKRCSTFPFRGCLVSERNSKSFATIYICT